MKYALITGSTKGIGKNVAQTLLKTKKWFVYLNYACDDKEAEKVNKEFKKYKNYTILKTDLSKFTITSKIITEITRPLDLIVLNAGKTIRKEFNELTITDWDYVFDVNLRSAFFIIQELYNNNNINKNASIIFIGSMFGEKPHSLSIPYGVSKGALAVLAKYLVKYLSKDGINVNVVSPGFVDTAWHKEKSQEVLNKLKDKIAMKRFCTKDEVTQTVLFLYRNKYITGQNITIDGGYCYE